jgi:hypothetical protein
LNKGLGAPTLACPAVVCAQCGQENPDGFRFCGSCAAPLVEAAPARQVRIAGRRDEAAAAFERALAVTRAKGATAWTKQIEGLLTEL